MLPRGLIPLHKPKSLGVYHQQLAYCVVQFVEKEQNLASIAITRLLRYWPVTNSQKELMFISEIEEVLEMISVSDSEFEKIMVPLFRRIGCCLNSSHFQSKPILNLTLNVRKLFSEMDEELVLACQSKYEEENSVSNGATKRRRLTWECLETAASYQPMPSDLSGLVKPHTCLVSC
nr:serine/threonine protein phosphatase 2A 57 kDa regulatory subunit B' kappa isoform-like [Ipomoea batatas]